jgi:hypothetical protein
MDEIVRAITIGTAAKVMISTTGIMIKKRLPVGREVSG